jgi:hypothetical protein
MAIGTMQGAAGFYDINRDMYNGMTASEAYEREMHYRRHQEAEYRRMQQGAYHNPAQQQAQLMSQVKQDPKDPLSFLSNTKLLLTGEAT